MDMQVRDKTRDAWNRLTSQGETPSVRKVYRLVGGKYKRVIDECRILRQQTNDAATESGMAACARPEPKAYVCNRFPEMRIGRSIKFCGGVYETSEAEEWALIERNDWYGVFIFQD